MKVNALLGDHQVDVKDMHSDPVDSFYLYPKLMPSSVRIKIIKHAQENEMSELKAMVSLLIERMKDE